uniref:Uncharacterized protein n=1 Tax=Arundo donax TaxID=35708 RepID=A0A0A9EKG2_ARUDO
MQFTLALDGSTHAHPMRRSGEGAGSDRLMERLNIGSIKQEKALMNRCFGGRVAGTAQCVLTSDAGVDTLHVQTQSSQKDYADANHVSASFWVEALELNSFL